MDTGLLYGGLAALLGGSFAIAPKTAMLRAGRAGSPIAQPVTAWWLSLGFVAASLALALFVPQPLSWWGALSGLLWALAVVGRVVAIQACGMGCGNAVPDAALLLTAWAYDATYNGQSFKCDLLAAAGVVLLLASIASICLLEQQGVYRRRLLAKVNELEGDKAGAAADGPAGHAPGASGGVHQPLLGQAHHSDHEAQAEGGAGGGPSGHCAHHAHAAFRCPLAHAADGSCEHANGNCLRMRLFGIAFGVASGICSGLSQWPFTLAPPGHGGLHFLLSSSIGMLVFASLNIVLHRALWRQPLLQAGDGLGLRVHDVGAAGVIGGAMLLGATAFGILAAGAPGYSYSAAKLLAQAGVLVSGGWGVLLFGELQGLLQVLFWLAGLQLLTGEAVLIMAGNLKC